MKHSLKILPHHYQDIISRTKKHELRLNDRSFAVGDELQLEEWEPKLGYSGRGIRATVTYIQEIKIATLAVYVIMSIEPIWEGGA